MIRCPPSCIHLLACGVSHNQCITQVPLLSLSQVYKPVSRPLDLQIHKPNHTTMPADTNPTGIRRIPLVRPAHIYYTHKNIDKSREFLINFGFKETKRVGKSTYYEGTGQDPWVYCAIEGDEDEFGGAAFLVESMDDLEYASKTLPEASKVYELTDVPGGGSCVTFKDPVDKFPFHLVFGQSFDHATGLPERQYNYVSMVLILYQLHWLTECDKAVGET